MFVGHCPEQSRYMFGGLPWSMPPIKPVVLRVWLGARHHVAYPLFPYSDLTKRQALYVKGALTKVRSRRRPRKSLLYQLDSKVMPPPLAWKGSRPPSSRFSPKVKATMGRGTLVRFGMPRCQRFEVRMSTS